MKAAVVLTPAESKKLIAKAVISKPEVQAALEKAYVILLEGTTNVYIARELFGKSITAEYFTSGMSMGGVLCNSKRDLRGAFPIIAYKREIVEKTTREALNHLHKETVVIKGGNAVDRDGIVGVIVSGYTGGSTAEIMGTCVSQGIRIISPVGLEKMVPSVIQAARVTGGKTFDYSMGSDYGLFVVPQADVVTEIEAINILSGARATHVASGGISGSEGAVMLVIEGADEQVKKAIGFIETVKGEPPQKGVRQPCTTCKYANCVYFNKKEEDLPSWLLKSLS